MNNSGLVNSIVKFHLTPKSYSNLKIIVRGIFKRAKKKKYVQFGVTELINNMEYQGRYSKAVKGRIPKRYLAKKNLRK